VHISLIIYQTEIVAMPTLQREIKHRSIPLYSAFRLGLLGYINQLEITTGINYFVYDAASFPPPYSHVKNVGQ
jgi:hypothetical protein